MPSSHVVEVHCSRDDRRGGLPETVQRAIVETLDRYSDVVCEVGVELVSADAIQRLNCQFRGVDAVTDVLSFGMDDTASSSPADLPGDLPRYLGDIAICVERALAQADEYGHSVEREFAYLAAHGALHLLGFDHDAPAGTRRMRAAEEQIMAAIGQPEPHADP